MPKTGGDEVNPANVASSSGRTGAPTATAGANNGTSPPAPVVTAGDNDVKGTITFGSGATPAAGAQVNVTLHPSSSFKGTPVVEVTPINDATDALGVFPTNISATGFTITAHTAPAASQPNTTYAVEYSIVV